MDKEEIKNRIDFNNIQEKTFNTFAEKDIKRDYLVDYEGNFIIPLSPLHLKLIEKIKELEERIVKLENPITEVTK